VKQNEIEFMKKKKVALVGRHLLKKTKQKNTATHFSGIMGWHIGMSILQLITI